MVRSAAVFAMTVAIVQAVNQPPPLPFDAQIGLLHFPVTCQIYGILNNTFETVFTATAPVTGGSGQQIYYTDVSGIIDIPSYIVSLSPFVNATQAQANVTVNLRLTNASPTNLLVYQATLNNIPFPRTGVAQIRIPQGNGTLPPLGPVTLGAKGVAHRIFLGTVDVSVELQDSSGRGVLGPVPVHCGAQNIDFVIGSVNVDNSTGKALAPSNGFIPSFPDTPLDFESGSFRFPYQCTFGILGKQNLDLSIGGTIPTYFNPGQQFSLTNADSFLRVPAGLIGAAKRFFPNATTLATTINGFNILFTNAAPAAYNIAKTPITSNVDITKATGEVIIPIPASNTLTVGPITAGAAGNIVGVAVGTANATAKVLDKNGKVLLNLPVTCNTPFPLELIGVPITTQQPGNYVLGIPQ